MGYNLARLVWAASSRKQMPPSSSGPGRSPLKAQTGVRVPLGAPKGIHPELHMWLKSSSFRCCVLSIDDNWRNCSPTESDWFGMFALIGQANSKKVRTYVSVKDAWKLYGYRQQYLRRLLRQKKLSGIKIGPAWLIEVPSLKNYLFLSSQSQDRRFGPRT